MEIGDNKLIHNLATTMILWLLKKYRDEGKSFVVCSFTEVEKSQYQHM